MNKVIERPDREPITLWLPGRVVPKARPRLGTRGVYMPPNYVAWKRSAVIVIQNYWHEIKCSTITEPISLQVIVIGFARGDGDNILGAIQDALVDAGAIENDTLNCIPKASIEYQASPALKRVYIEINAHVIQVFKHLKSNQIYEKQGLFLSQEKRN